MSEDTKILENKIDCLVDDIHAQGENWSTEIKEIKLRFDNFEERLDSHADMLSALFHWKNSNGSPGAEERIRKATEGMADMDRTNIAPRLNMIEADIRVLQNITDSTIRAGVQTAVTDTLDKRARTAVEILKAWGPILAAALAAIAVVLAAIL
jgi:hypothetical protein